MQNANGGTALMLAAMFGRNEVLQLLLAKEADKTIGHTPGLTALALAQQQENEPAIKLLQERATDGPAAGR